MTTISLTIVFVAGLLVVMWCAWCESRQGSPDASPQRKADAIPIECADWARHRYRPCVSPEARRRLLAKWKVGVN